MSILRKAKGRTALSRALPSLSICHFGGFLVSYHWREDIRMNHLVKTSEEIAGKLGENCHGISRSHMMTISPNTFSRGKTQALGIFGCDAWRNAWLKSDRAQPPLLESTEIISYMY